MGWRGCAKPAAGLQAIHRGLPPVFRIEFFGGLGMTIESDELTNLRETTNRALLVVLWLHAPIAIAIGIMRGTDWMLPAELREAVALGGTVAWGAAGNALSTRLVFAIALLGQVSVFTFQFAG